MLTCDELIVVIVAAVIGDGPSTRFGLCDCSLPVLFHLITVNISLSCLHRTSTVIFVFFDYIFALFLMDHFSPIKQIRQFLAS